MFRKSVRLGYLILDHQFAPNLHFKLPEEIVENFSWTDSTQTKWNYQRPGVCNLTFAVGDDVYDSSCPLLGIYDLNNDEHLQKIVNRSWNQQMVTEDLHLYD